MTAIVFRPEARIDALSAFEWYEEQRSGLGVAFRVELDATLERIRNAPLSFPVQYRDLRRALVVRFPYAVFFRVMNATIVVVAVIHGRRHPHVWKSRV